MNDQPKTRTSYLNISDALGEHMYVSLKDGCAQMYIRTGEVEFARKIRSCFLALVLFGIRPWKKYQNLSKTIEDQ